MGEGEFDFLGEEDRKVLLNLVLTWGKIDVSLGYFASIFLPEEAVFNVADALEKKNASGRLNEVIKLLREQPETESLENILTILKKSKKKLRKFGKIRDHLAHSKLVGWSNERQEFLLFIKFERVGKNGLAQYEIHIQDFRYALSWGSEFDDWLRKMIFAVRKSDKEDK